MTLDPCRTDVASQVVFDFDVATSNLRRSADNCTVTYVDHRTYNTSVWTVFPYLPVRDVIRVER
jgi:hypothetical protein